MLFIATAYAIAQLVRRTILLLPAAIFAHVLYLRSNASYEAYANPELADSSARALAQQGFWLDILTAATQPDQLLMVSVVCFAIAFILTLCDINAPASARHGLSGASGRKAVSK